ncbi:hypothetical protein TEA_000183 [Camellia sinensis var. sinensis]|uniref:mRNA decay factor PAT1 domain-containing protein n=1 Tax=Camellia sinensis var. sinensis TaxID=542762 RepID=A0A4S4EZ99_CAMSN|nr:hypothetical protein TEA_000183 [Camellia sinensis var. sinensis]
MYRTYTLTCVMHSLRSTIEVAELTTLLSILSSKRVMLVSSTKIVLGSPLPHPVFSNHASACHRPRWHLPMRNLFILRHNTPLGKSENALFNASQYAFFGQEAVEEVELGGLEDDIPVIGYGDDEYHLFDKEEKLKVETNPLLGYMEVLSSSRVHLDHSSCDVITFKEKGFGGGQWVVVSGWWLLKMDLSKWSNEGSGIGSLSDIDDLTSTFSKLNKVVTGPRHPGVIGDRGSGSISRESSSAAEWSQEADFPDCNNSSNNSSNTFPANLFWYPNHLLCFFPPPGGRSQQASPRNQSHHLNIFSHTGGHQLPFSAPNFSPLSSSNLHLAGLPHGLHYGGNMAQLDPSGLSINSRSQNHWANHAGMFHGDHSNHLNNISQQQFSYQKGLLSSQLLPSQQQLQQQRMHLPVQPSLAHFSAMQSQVFNALTSSPAHLSKYGLVDMRDQRLKSSQRGRQNIRLSQQGSDTSNQKTDSGCPQFRSKYMTSEEIESILRMQHAVTHGNDPYVDDYYHQARLAKKASELGSKHRFCPIHPKELTSRSRNSADSLPHLQVDALGRVSFSSIRRPRPLLEVDPPSSASGNGSAEQVSEKPLEQEPMLAARITIEDGICLLLDIDDIDRLLQFSQPQDGGTQLRRRRQILLEGLAASLQLVDPLGKSSSVGLAPKDDIVFLRLVSLAKGAAETITNLVKIVSTCVNGMDLNALSACLAAVVCSAEQPPLRPLGSPAGDGASVILISVLERATKLLTDPRAASNCSIPNPALWQASFDAFFGLLTKYCVSKYDSLVQSIYMHGQPSSEIIDSETTRAISKEMPVELLRASLPHTDEQQRKLLLDFAQQSMPITGFNANGGSGGQVTPKSVKG